VRESVEGAIRSATRASTDAEVLVVVNGRDRAPALRAIDSPALRVLFLDQRNLARARNIGLDQARHDTVLFGDDGAAYPLSWCAELAGALRDARYPVVTAPVRVPVHGPVTAYLDYQRVFDAPPVDGVQAQTVTGNCGLRRDLVPPAIRFDEVNTPMVAEDVTFGHALRAAGIRIRWLADAAPGLHTLPERVEEIIDRFLRYGRGAAHVWWRGTAPAISPPRLLALARRLAAGHHVGYRRFPEIAPPGVRAAFTVYDRMLDVAFLVGALDELGELGELGDRAGRPVVAADLAALRDAWRDVGARAGALADWCDLRVDLSRLDSRTDAAEPLVTEIVAAFGRFVQPSAVGAAPEPAVVSGADVPGIAGVAGERLYPPHRPAQFPGGSDPSRLLEVWRQAIGTGEPLVPAELNRRVRAAGFSYRTACSLIERSAVQPG
jgi:hypothetical protein